MKEEFLQYIWKHKLYSSSGLKSTKNEKIKILNPGIHNKDSGPDFFNAKVQINKTIWAGNVEIHVNSSDWYAHKHDQDKAYDNVVLQVVYKHNKEITNTKGYLIPTLEIEFDHRLLKNYESLIANETWISCQDNLKNVDAFIIENWLDKLTIERLEDKSEQIHQLLDQTKNSWENAFYIFLARNFGFKLNAQPFEQLAKSLPLKYLAKHKDNLLQIEALLFGQAGFLIDEKGDDYFEKLKTEYCYLQKKFNLQGIQNHLWKFLRSRPGNFPTIRIAQFANLIYKSRALFSKILETKTLSEFYKLFMVKPSDYWDNHYVFNKKSIYKSKTLGKSAIDILLINTVIPFLFVYAKSKGLSEMQDRALDLLEKIKSEKNSIVKKWGEIGIKSTNAYQSQALIQLKNRYCSRKKCLNCQVGNYLIQQANETKEI